MTTDPKKIRHDIIAEILSRVPAKSLLRFRCVSKSWCSLISDPDFTEKRLNRQIQNNNFSLIFRPQAGPAAETESVDYYSIDYNSLSHEPESEVEAIKLDCPVKSPYHNNDFTIVGSCNGLLCIRYLNWWGEHIYVWNPCTKQFKKIPSLPVVVPSFIASYGFGYDSKIDDYKLLRIFHFNGDDNEENFDCEVHVYTLRTNAWRRLEHIPHWVPHWIPNEGVRLVSGVLHWEREKAGRSISIVGFDLVDEEFKEEVPQPDYVYDKRFSTSVGGVLGGCLALFCNSYEDRLIDVWVMKDYGVKESWSKMFTISKANLIQTCGYLRVLCFSKTGEVLLSSRDEELVLYDPKSASARTLQIRGIHRLLIEMETYTESLVSF